MKRLLIIILFALLSAIVLTGCATRRQLQVVDRISHDTLYLSNAHYDSIPVVKTIVETKVERHVPAIYRLSLSILIILTLSLIIYIVWKIHI